MDAPSVMDLMEVDAPSMPTCALNCEALDMALDEIIASAAGKERSKSAAAGQAVSTETIVFGKKAASSRRGRNSAKGGASGGFQKTMLSGIKNRPTKKRGVQSAARNQMRMGSRAKDKEAYTSKQGSKFQGRGQNMRPQQSHGNGSRVFVNRGQSYVIVAKNSSSKRPRGPGYLPSRQSRSYTRQNVWRSSSRASYQGFQSRGGRMNNNQRSFVQQGWNDNRQDNYSNQAGRSRWIDNRRDVQYGVPESQSGLYQPPHRRDEKPNTNRAQPGNFGWGNSKRTNGKFSFGQRSYAKIPNQSKKVFGGF